MTLAAAPWRARGWAKAETKLTATIELDGGSDRLRRDWRRLAERRGNAFITPDWSSVWCACYGRNARSYLVAVREPDGGDLVGVLPLMLTGRTLRFAGANVGDHFHPACAPERETEVAVAAAGALAAQGPRWTTLALDNVTSGAQWVQALRAAWPSRLATATVRANTLPYIDIAGHTWDSWVGGRSRNFRSQIGRRTRALQRDHGATFRRTERALDIEDDMATFFSLHDARWDTRGGSSSQGRRVREFHTAWAAAALKRGWLRLWFLEVEGRSVAAWYGWSIGGRYSYYLAGFDPDWSKQAVGLVLLAHTVREAIEEGAEVYDMLLGDEGYKSRFASGQQTVETLLVTPALHPARVLASAESRARKLERALPERTRERVRGASQAIATRFPSGRSR